MIEYMFIYLASISKVITGFSKLLIKEHIYVQWLKLIAQFFKCKYIYIYISIYIYKVLNKLKIKLSKSK